MDYNTLIDYTEYGLKIVLVLIAGMIKIPKLELNLWSFLARGLGRALNKEIMDKVDKLSKDFETHLKLEEEDKAVAARRRILRCESDLRRGNDYTKEGFDELLRDIDQYNTFCNEHPDYENAKAVIAIDYILEEYADCVKHNRFLA